MPRQVTDGEVVESRAQQRESSKRATFDLLRNKKRAEREVMVKLTNGDGEIEEVSMFFIAIGSQDYDKLITKHPPTTDQKAQGSSYNINTFGPALLSKVCVDPDLDSKQWAELWNSPDWNRGEIMEMFFIAINLCNKGLDIPFSDND